MELNLFRMNVNDWKSGVSCSCMSLSEFIQVGEFTEFQKPVLAQLSLY